MQEEKPGVETRTGLVDSAGQAGAGQVTRPLEVAPELWEPQKPLELVGCTLEGLGV